MASRANERSYSPASRKKIETLLPVLEAYNYDKDDVHALIKRCGYDDESIQRAVNEILSDRQNHEQGEWQDVSRKKEKKAPQKRRDGDKDTRIENRNSVVPGYEPRGRGQGRGDDRRGGKPAPSNQQSQPRPRAPVQAAPGARPAQAQPQQPTTVTAVQAPISSSAPRKPDSSSSWVGWGQQRTVVAAPSEPKEVHTPAPVSQPPVTELAPQPAIHTEDQILHQHQPPKPSQPVVQKPVEHHDDPVIMPSSSFLPSQPLHVQFGSLNLGLGDHLSDKNEPAAAFNKHPAARNEPKQMTSTGVDAMPQMFPTNPAAAFMPTDASKDVQQQQHHVPHPAGMQMPFAAGMHMNPYAYPYMHQQQYQYGYGSPYGMMGSYPGAKPAPPGMAGPYNRSMPTGYGEYDEASMYPTQQSQYPANATQPGQTGAPQGYGAHPYGGQQPGNYNTQYMQQYMQPSQQLGGFQHQQQQHQQHGANRYHQWGSS